MNKFSSNFFLLIVSLILLCGCQKNFLDRQPLDRISNSTFWNTENDLIVYNNGLYNMARNNVDVPIMMGNLTDFDSHWANLWSLDEYSDNLAPTNTRHTFYVETRSGKQHVPDSPQQFGWVGWDFVRAINIGLDHYYNASISTATINKYAAEARLFRGWFYGDKVSKFGDVPWISHELSVDSDELFGPRTPREEVMDSVLADLTFACDNLPSNWGDGGAPGRLNRWAALLVKSRICLFEGTWRKYHGGDNVDMWLQQAADAAEELIDSGPYTIYSTGDPLHDYNSYQRSNDLTGNSEVIYWRKYQTGVITTAALAYFMSYNGGATKSMVEDYLCTDGLPISLSPLYKGDDKIEDVFENRDPRLRQTVLHPDDMPYYDIGKTTAYTYPRVQGMSGGDITNTGYHVIKYYRSSIVGLAYNSEITPSITLRLGEAMLNFAEAKAELGTLTQADLDKSINKLRDRVGMIHMDLNSIPVDPRYIDDGVSPIIVEIRRERRVEMFAEGLRYEDLLRWKQGKKLEIHTMGIRWNDAAIARYPGATVKSSVDPISGKTYIDVYKGSDWDNPVFDENKHYLWPIPLSALSQNPKLGQNPGWE